MRSYCGSAASFTDYYWPRRWGLLLYITAGTIAGAHMALRCVVDETR